MRHGLAAIRKSRPEWMDRDETVILGPMKTPVRLPILLAIGSLLSLASCMVDQSIVLNPDLSGNTEISGSAMGFAGIALDDLAVLGGFDSASALYEDALLQSRGDMAARDDIASFSAQLTDEHSWEARADFADLELLLGRAEAGGMVNLERSGTVSKLTLLFDRSSAETFGSLVPLTQNPAFSLFDPASTGGIDEETYITDILGFTFGPENVPEIRTARYALTLTLPGTVTAVTGGEQLSDRTVRFEIPLSRLMTPEPPVIWSVSWR